MLVRIVRLTFLPEEAWRFPEVFRAAVPKQARMGCTSNRMYLQAGTDNIFVTISEWESAEALEGYRKSDLFYDTWGKLKPYFCAPAEAYSLTEVI